MTLLQLVAQDASGVAMRLSEQAGISRQAASLRLRKAVDNGLVTRVGTGAGVRYLLAPLADVRQDLDRAGLSEDRVWQQWLAPIVADLPENVRDIWRYGMTEMINNAIDHSGAGRIQVGMRRDALAVRGWVSDDGQGIFVRIQRALDLFEPREAILELAKGKFTTDPEHHSGEGIFFTSKVFDAFGIRSGLLHFSHDAAQVDMLIERATEANGTHVSMQLANDSKRIARDVFDAYAAPEEFTFAKTLVPVRLAQHEGEKLVARSQARRLTMRFERFQTVVLDFSGVADIGQAFADEVFRVFQRRYPETTLVPVNMVTTVSDMVARARAAAR